MYKPVHLKLRKYDQDVRFVCKDDKNKEFLYYPIFIFSPDDIRYFLNLARILTSKIVSMDNKDTKKKIIEARMKATKKGEHELTSSYNSLLMKYKGQLLDIARLFQCTSGQLVDKDYRPEAFVDLIIYDKVRVHESGEKRVPYKEFVQRYYVID